MTPAPPPVPATVIADRDVEFSNVGGKQTMDIIRPREAAKAPRPADVAVDADHAGV